MRVIITHTNSQASKNNPLSIWALIDPLPFSARSIFYSYHEVQRIHSLDSLSGAL
jgi:hypothetical protein